MRFSSVISVVFGVAVAGCSTRNAATCSPPAQTTYACTPVSPEAGACQGGPKAFGGMPDPDKGFPLGCQATLPLCASAYPSEIQTCSCSKNALPDGGAGWTCPI